MKTILVPTDFSKVAENAINYAAEMAKITKAKLILFHAYHVPVITSEVPVVIPRNDELESDCLKGLEQIKSKLQASYGNYLPVECVCKYGLTVDEINSYTSAHKTDLIVMGMQGAGFFTEKFLGSVTTSLLHNTHCPVLAIDESVRFKTIKNIVLACDYNETENQEVLRPLKEFARIFKSHIYVLNVVREAEPALPIQQVVSDFIRLEHSLADVNHSFHYLSNEEIVEGINEFVKQRGIDLVVMIPRKHSMLKNIFQEPNTKRMAFHSKVPLLALH